MTTNYEELARGWAESFYKLFGGAQGWGGEINGLLALLGAETIEIPAAPPITEAINTGFVRLKAAIEELLCRHDRAVGQVKKNEAYRGLMAALRRAGLHLPSDKFREVLGRIVDETISTETALEQAKEAGWTQPSERCEGSGRAIAMRPPLQPPAEWLGENGEDAEAAKEVGDIEDEAADEPALEGEDTGDFVPDSPGDEPPAASPPIEAIKAATKPAATKKAPAKKAAPTAKKTAPAAKSVAKKAAPAKKPATKKAA